MHHHFLPPAFAKAASERSLLNPMLRSLDIARSLEEMDRNDIASAVLSIPNPGAWYGEASFARYIARDANEYAARVVDEHKGRFGFFATLPLPDVEGALSEAAYSLDVLHADGIHMWTSYGDFWLGDPRLSPLLEELNRRHAVVYTHPTMPGCCGCTVPEAPITMIEYGTDTTRAIASLVLSGAASRYPDIRWIFSHAGGTMPFLLERFLLQEKVQSRSPEGATKIPNGVLYELQKLHYDTAQSSNANALGPLLRIAPVSQVLLGSDFPYREIADNVSGLAACGLFDAVALRAVERDNAARLLPRLMCN
ncbi:Predicted metal-dependent hydrolase, TIM-barrel fold [Beijerinckia sp. 28-YEA-48]|nr:Predicted metal-dependent hydrolase, TIM-barrel fold [Beijerinckia sp. 28-YEA-48]